MLEMFEELGYLTFNLPPTPPVHFQNHFVFAMLSMDRLSCVEIAGGWMKERLGWNVSAGVDLNSSIGDFGWIKVKVYLPCNKQVMC